MKFRLPFQIYRTGVISRSSSPGKILYKFSKDNEAKVRKKTSKINSSYRAIISNYIYSFTHLPLKVTLSKLRNRTKLRSSIKSHKTKIRNEFVFLQEALKDNSAHKKAKSVKVTNDTSECCMNSIKCANFMCAKSTAKMLLQQKDLLCNKKSKKSVATNPEDEKPKENNNSKNVITKSTNVVEKEIKSINNTAPPPLKKIKKPLEMPIIEKHKANEYKWKLNKSEAVASSSELKRLKRRLQNADDNRNYKIEEKPPVPIRMDSIMGTSHIPKKLPELPVQIMPKIERARPKEGPSLVAPKRKYEAPEMTRNYKKVENVQHGPPRMDTVLGCKAEPKDMGPEIKLPQENLKQPINKGNTMGEDKDAFLFKLDRVVNDLMPKNRRSTWNLQQVNKGNINVSEKIKRFEELIGNSDHRSRSRSQGIQSRLVEDQLLTQSQKMEKRDLSILSPKLSPFAIAEIRRKYYPSDTFEKERPKLKIPVNAVPFIEKNDIRADIKIKQLYSRPKEQYKNLDENILDINPSGNIRKKHAKLRNSITCHNGVAKQKDILTIDVDNSNSDSFGDCSTCSTLETSTIHVPKVLIPPPSKAATAPENKRNYSSTAIYEYNETFNGLPELLNSSFNLMKPNLTTKSNLYNNIPPIERMSSASVKKCGEINSEVTRAKKRNNMESNSMLYDLDNIKPDRRNLDDNARELDKSYTSNSNLHHTSQRNLSKRHCTIKVTSTLDNQDNEVSSPVEGSEKLTRKLSYQYYHEQCSISKNVDDFEMSTITLPANPSNEVNAATLVINTDGIVTNERYEKMLNDKKTLINNYIKWKMQLHKFGSATKKSNKSSKCCLNFMNRIYKQNKYKMRKYKIIHGKQRNISADTLTVQQEQNKAISSTVNLIKSQVAHKCLLFDKISDALLKKTDIINYCNQTSKDVQQKEDKITYLRHNNKRKLSRVPILETSPKKKIIPILETKKVTLAPETKKYIPVQETKKLSPVQEAKYVIPVPEAKNVITSPVAKNATPIPEVKNVTPVLEAKVVTPVWEAKLVNPVSEAKIVTPASEAKIVTPVSEAKIVTPVLEAKIVTPVSKAKISTPVLEAKVVTPVPDTRNVIEYMEVDEPPLQANASGPPYRAEEEICNRRKTISQLSSSRHICLQHTIKIKPPAIPATMKAKKFLAKIEAEPKQLGNMLLKKIDRKIKRQKSIKSKLLSTDKIGKFIAYV